MCEYNTVKPSSSQMINQPILVLEKDFFVDLVENIVEPCKQQRWGKNEMDLVVSSIAGTFPECETAHSRQTGRPSPHEKPWRTVYLRYIDTLRLCVLTVYHD